MASSLVLIRTKVYCYTHRIYIKPTYLVIAETRGEIMTEPPSERVRISTSKVKVTCPVSLFNEINVLIASKGEYANISDYSESAARFLLNDMYSRFIPAMWDKLESIGCAKNGSILIVANKIKIKSNYGGKSISFQVSMPLGLINSYRDAEFCIFNTFTTSELIRYSLEYYLIALKKRMADGAKCLEAHLYEKEMPPITDQKPIIEFESQ